jgi:hypothetical protein
MVPWSAVRAFLVAVGLALPLVRVARSDKKLTWTSAVLLGGWLTAITVVLLGDVPSRLLYWFDETHSTLAAKFGFLAWWENIVGGNPGYQIVADIVANSVQGIFFVIIAALAYFWGEHHRKAGKF